MLPLVETAPSLLYGIPGEPLGKAFPKAGESRGIRELQPSCARPHPHLQQGERCNIKEQGGGQIGIFEEGNLAGGRSEIRRKKRGKKKKGKEGKKGSFEIEALADRTWRVGR